MEPSGAALSVAALATNTQKANARTSSLFTNDYPYDDKIAWSGMYAPFPLHAIASILRGGDSLLNGDDDSLKKRYRGMLARPERTARTETAG